MSRGRSSIVTDIVGQGGNLRPIGNRPGAAPPKCLRAPHQSSSNGIHFDISADPLELRQIPNQPIIAFILPERPGTTEHSIRLPLPGCGRGGKRTVHREASAQPPGKKNGLPQRRIMRQTANMKVAHDNRVFSASWILEKTTGRLPIGRRLPTCPTIPGNP